MEQKASDGVVSVIESVTRGVSADKKSRVCSREQSSMLCRSVVSPLRDMNALTCFVLTAVCVAGVCAAPLEPTTLGVDNKTTSMSHTDGTDADDVDAFLLDPEPVPDGKPHNLQMGECDKLDGLLHSETLIVNNDGTSRVAGDIRVNVEAAVNITCFKVLDQAGENSGAFPSFKDGGLGHNYVVLGFDTAYGYGFNFLVELYGHDTNQ